MSKSATSAPYQILPPLEADAFESLKADILERGVLVPIERDDRGALLDGHHRVRALEELRLAGHLVAQPPVLIRAGLTESEKRAHVRSLNLHRRHLSAAQRRQVIAAQLADAPDASDRVIARRLAVSHTTVATVRKRMGVLTGQLGQLRARRGADGKMRRLPMSRSMMAISESQAPSGYHRANAGLAFGIWSRIGYGPKHELSPEGAQAFV